MPGDIVYPDWATENLQVHYNPNHKWYYLPDQTVDEVLIFKSAESSPSKCQGKRLSGSVLCRPLVESETSRENDHS